MKNEVLNNEIIRIKNELGPIISRIALCAALEFCNALSSTLKKRIG